MTDPLWNIEFFCIPRISMFPSLSIYCSQPLYWVHAEENSGEVSAKHAGVGGAVSKRSEQEEIKAVEPFGKKSTY